VSISGEDYEISHFFFKSSNVFKICVSKHFLLNDFFTLNDFFNIFISFLYADIENNFFKKYYFNIFVSEMYFKKQPLLHY
jgi:hypothetical protein